MNKIISWRNRSNTLYIVNINLKSCTFRRRAGDWLLEEFRRTSADEEIRLRSHTAPGVLGYKPHSAALVFKVPEKRQTERGILHQVLHQHCFAFSEFLISEIPAGQCQNRCAIICNFYENSPKYFLPACSIDWMPWNNWNNVAVFHEVAIK